MPGPSALLPPPPASGPVADAGELAVAKARLAMSEQARELAEQACALKSRLLAFASHDLKSPLSSLRTTCDLLAAATGDPVEIHALVRLMQAEVRRMTRLVHDFLDRAALDAGALRIEFVPLDLVPLAEQALAEFALPARLKHQTLWFQRPIAPPPLILGEASRLDQILANLLDNAVRYSPFEGRITLSLGHDAGYVWCAVEDTGPGLAPADVERVFEPFERLGARPSGGDHSQGLGLTLAREFARLHHGTLRAESRPGLGARFVLSLPAAASPPTGAATSVTFARS
jgi:signal transduction histidine kinase